MHATDVGSDATVALKWFHAEGEEEVEASRALLDAHGTRRIALAVLGLTPYELGNALLRGRAKARAEQVATVLESLREICPTLSPSPAQLRLAAALAERHGLTLHDAAYAATARDHGATLATLDSTLLTAGPGRRPSEIAAGLGLPAERSA